MSPLISGNSYWMESVPGTPLPALSGDAHAHVCVVGGGITGLLCAYELAEDAVLITKARDGRALNEAALNTALLNVASGAHSLEGCQVPFSFTTVPAQVLTAREVYDEIAGEMKNAGYDAATDSITPEQLGAEFDVTAAQKVLDEAEPGTVVEIDAAIEYPRVTAE